MVSLKSRAWRAILEGIFGICAVIFPMFAVWSSTRAIGSDYAIQVWMIGYQGEVWKSNHAFAPVYNSDYHVGVPTPVFYGGPLYKFAGLLSSVWGSHAAIRLVALFSLASVYIVVRFTARAFGTGVAFATNAACAACWMTYSLTNFYNRIALAEFFAGSMLVCGCCLLAQFLFRPGPAVRWYTALAAALFLCLTVSTHPITAMLSIPIVGLLYVCHWFVPVERPGILRRHAALLVGGVLVCLTLSPWLYAYKTLSSQLLIAGAIDHKSSLWYGDLPTKKSLWIRVFPIPFDYNQMTPEAPKHGTIHLDAQVSLPLLALAGIVSFAAYRSTTSGRRWRLLLSLGVCGLFGFVMLLVSASPDFLHNLPATLRKFACMAQFAYRYVGIVNVSFVVLLLLGLAFRHAAQPQGETWKGPPVLLAVLLTLSGCCLLQKMMNGRAGAVHHGWPTKRSDPAYTTILKSTGMHAAADFAMPKSYTQLNSQQMSQVHDITLPVQTERKFGRTQSVQVTLPVDGYVGTQTIPFAWNTLKVDGVAVPRDQLQMWQTDRYGSGIAGMRLAAPVPAGTHTVEYEFTPPHTWRVLNVVAGGVLVGWVALLVFWPPMVLLHRGVKGSKPAPAPSPSATAQREQPVPPEDSQNEERRAA